MYFLPSSPFLLSSSLSEVSVSIASPKGSTPVSLGRIRLSVTAGHIGPALQLLMVLWAWKMCVSMEKRGWGANCYACVTMGAETEEKPAGQAGISAERNTS